MPEYRGTSSSTLLLGKGIRAALAGSALLLALAAGAVAMLPPSVAPAAVAVAVAGWFRTRKLGYVSVSTRLGIFWFSSLPWPSRPVRSMIQGWSRQVKMNDKGVTFGLEFKYRSYP